MFRNLLAFPLLALIVILQSTVVSQITLLAGFADLVLVVLAAWALNVDESVAWLWGILGSAMVSFVSEMPWIVVFSGYFFVVFLSQVLRRRVWQAPLLAMFSVVLIGGLLMNIFSLLVLNVLGRPLPFLDSLGLVILPSLLLDLIFAIPVFVIVLDMVRWIFPQQEVE